MRPRYAADRSFDVRLIKWFLESDYRDGLESWTWLELGDKRPLFASLFGDVFFKAADSYWFLDTVEGTLTKEWRRNVDVEDALETPEGQERYLRASLANDAAAAGLQLGTFDVYAFEAGNLAVARFAVALNRCGRLHARAFTAG